MSSPSNHPLEVDGLRLNQVDWSPPVPARAAAVLVHGHGDCAERHQTTVAPLLDRGIACSAVDLPGHGRSPGRRGAVPGFAAVTRILDACAGRFGERTGLPVSGWVAHSMGALLAIHHLAHPGRPAPRFLWLSSPLTDPAVGQPAAMVLVARLLGRLLPGLRVGTGVRVADCHCDDGHEDPLQAPIAEFGHDRITLGWARELFELAASLPAAAARLDPATHLLLSQGLDDPICPPALSERLFEQLPMRSKRWLPLPGGRHEPFADGHVTALHQGVGSWLDETVLPS